MEGAKAFLEREYNGFLDEFDEQELYDIVVAMEDYASQQVKILPIADVGETFYCMNNEGTERDDMRCKSQCDSCNGY
jgi:hypothetical protein